MSNKRRARLSVTDVEMYLITVDINGNYITKPVDEFIVDLINEVQSVREELTRTKKRVKDIEDSG